MNRNPKECLTLWRGFAGEAGVSLEHCIEHFLKISKPRCRNNDRVSSPADIFCNAQETTSRIFFESKNKGLSFDLNPLCAQGLLVDMRLARIPRIICGVWGTFSWGHMRIRFRPRFDGYSFTIRYHKVFVKPSL